MSAHDDAAAALQAIASHDGMQGAIVASRDGLLVLGTTENGQPETLAAMSAAALAALETSSIDAGAGDVTQLMANCESGALMIVGLTPDHLLVAVADSDAHASAAFTSLGEALREALAAAK